MLIYVRKIKILLSIGSPTDQLTAKTIIPNDLKFLGKVLIYNLYIGTLRNDLFENSIFKGQNSFRMWAGCVRFIHFLVTY